MKINRRSNFDEHLSKRFEDKDFKKAFLEHQQAFSLGAEITRLRKSEGLSQGQLAVRVGMHKQNIARLERLTYESFTLKTLHRIAVALGKRLEVRFVELHQ